MLLIAGGHMIKVLLLDDIGKYIRKNPNYWYAYVNGVYKDGYQKPRMA